MFDKDFVTNKMNKQVIKLRSKFIDRSLTIISPSAYHVNWNIYRMHVSAEFVVAYVAAVISKQA